MEDQQAQKEPSILFPGGNILAEICADKNSYYRIENWYPDIKDYTFKTRTIPLTLQEANAIKEHAEQLHNVLLTKKLQQVGASQWTDADYHEAAQEVLSFLAADEVKALENLEHRIDTIIAEFIESGRGFVKLSTRSPKDAAFSISQMNDILKDSIEKSTAVGGSEESQIEDMIFFTRASCQVLCVKNGREAVTLLSRSKRIRTDLMMAELQAKNKNECNLSLVIREWNNLVLPEWEFRVFIFNGKITAATQYSHLIYVPDFVKKKNQIKEFILDYWNKVKGSIKCETYTMDLALDPNLKYAFIIELNGPPPNAGTSLFEWFDPKDRAQIESGATFELRVRDSLPRGVRDMIHQPNRRFMDQLRGVPDAHEATLFRHTSCTNCHRFPISSTFYHCDQCIEYDLCLDCMDKGAHKPVGHKIKKIVCEGDNPGKTVRNTTKVLRNAAIVCAVSVAVVVLVKLFK